MTETSKKKPLRAGQRCLGPGQTTLPDSATPSGHSAPVAYEPT